MLIKIASEKKKKSRTQKIADSVTELRELKLLVEKKVQKIQFLLNLRKQKLQNLALTSNTNSLNYLRALPAESLIALMLVIQLHL